MEEKSKKRTITKKKSLTTKKSKNVFLKLLGDYFKFYKENLRKKHIIIYIICMLVLFLVIVNYMSKIGSTPDISKLAENFENVSSQSSNVVSIIKNDIFVIFLIIFAGLTPYCYLSIIGFMSVFTFALDITNSFSLINGGASIVWICIGVIIQLFAISLAIAMGIYYCNVSTKRWRYTRGKSYTWLDMKKAFYTGLKKDKKLEQVNEKLDKRAIENEKLNIKVPYDKLIISFIIASIIAIIGALISLI